MNYDFIYFFTQALGPKNMDSILNQRKEILEKNKTPIILELPKIKFLGLEVKFSDVQTPIVKSEENG